LDATSHFGGDQPRHQLNTVSKTIGQALRWALGLSGKN